MLCFFCLGDIFIDQDIKLFEFVDIQKYSGYNDGPKSKEFCRFYSSSSSKDLDGFDSSIFWSAGLFWKNFRTCGVEKWDQELRDLVEHYRNWKAWTHEVHNLPNTKKFSDNPYSGPASTSTSYSRDRKSSGNINSSGSSYKPTSAKNPPTPTVHYSPSVAPPAPSPVLTVPPILTAPPVGQTVLFPIPGPDGSLVQVQLSTLHSTPLSSTAVPGSASLTAPSRFRYINPHMVPTMSTLNTSHPPPGYTLLSSSWTNQVDDFLSNPKSRTSTGHISNSPVTSRFKAPPILSKSEGSLKVKLGSKRKVSLVSIHTSSPMKKGKISPIKMRKISRSKILARMRAREEEEDKFDKMDKVKFTPKASILPPSPAGKTDVNELDFSPEYKQYNKGEIMVRRFVNKCFSLNSYSSGMEGKVWLH